MLKYFIYYASYFFMAYVVWGLVKGKNRPAGDVLFLVGVALVPLGKLFYIPVTGLVSVTAAFIFTTIIGGGTLLVSFIKGVPRYVFVPFMSIIPALLSIIFLYAPSQSMFVQASANAASAGSPLLRVVSIFFTSVYCAWVVIYVSQRENGYKLLAKYYVMGTLFATFVGVFIAYGIFFGILDKPDLMPVAVEDIHMAGRIYRFNPGASVNEFGEIIGYAIFMLRWTGWTTTRKMVAAIVLILALFFSLTRGAWLGMVVGYLAYAAFSSRAQRKNILLAAAGVIVVLLAVVLSSDELTFLLVSRTSFGYSPGSDDRLNTASAVFDAITRTPVRMLFGYGWAADIFSPNYGFDRIGYIHSVPLMFLFDTGAVGVAFCCAIFFAFGRFAYANIRKDLDIYAGLIVFMFIVSTVEHIFFHVQTWLIFGLLIGLAFKAAEERKQELAARLSQARTS